MNLPVRTIPVKQILPDGNENNDNTIITTKYLQIQQQGVGPGKTGLAVWNSSLLLGRLLEALAWHNPTWLRLGHNNAADSNSNSNGNNQRQQRVAELGAGTGLVSIIANKLGAKSVWTTDGNPAAVALAQQNFRRNYIEFTTTVTENSDNSNSNVVTVLPWGELQVPMEWMGQADIVLGSDLTYNSGSWRVLAETMEGLLSNKDGIVIYLTLGHSGFNARGEMDGFINVAKQLGLKTVTSSYELPFALPRGINSLDGLLQSLIQPSEQSILAATGGAEVVVLKRK